MSSRLTCVVTVVLGCALCGTLAAGTPPQSSLEFGQLPAVKTPAPYPLLDSSLNAVLAKSAVTCDHADPDCTSSVGRTVVEVQIEPWAVDEVYDWLEAAGGTGILVSDHKAQAELDLSALIGLSEQPGVLMVRQPMPTISAAMVTDDARTGVAALAKTGSWVSEGVAAINASLWQGQGYRGQGIRVGIIDEGFYGYQSRLGGELPPSNRVFYRRFSSTTSTVSSGTVNAEILTDVAPDCTLFLAEISSPLEAVAAVDWLRTNSVDIIVTNQFQVPESAGDGSGPFAQLADQLFAEGRLPVIPAGNFRITHWQGRFSDTNGNRWHEFAPGDETNNMTDGTNPFYSPAGVRVWGAMVWDEWQNPPTDLDICAVVDYNDGTGAHVLQCSEDLQNGSPGQLPRELMDFTTPASGYYSFAINRYSGSRNPDIEVFLSREDAIPYYRSADGSLMEPAESLQAITVGAVDAVTHSLEVYSSKGPTNGPGGTLSGGRIKPDLAGPSLVSNSVFGSRSFYGTGPAAMHVAGAAALVWSAYPSWTSSQIRSFLYDRALDAGPTGRDNDYGYGRLWLGSPPAQCIYSISPTSGSFGASGGSGSFNLTTNSGCSWSATANAGWIHLSNPSGSGSATVSFQVDANSSTSQRSGAITVEGQTYTVTQAGAASCNYQVSPTTASFGASGGQGTLTVSTTAGCSWTAASGAGWVTISGGASGSGNGTVTYQVANNSSSSSRSATLTVAGVAVTINQSGQAACDYQVTPTSVSVGATGGQGALTVTTASGCSWTASSAAGWVTITGGSSGSGNGTVTFQVANNSSSSSRSTTLTVAGITVAITQAGATSCSYDVSPTSASYGPSGGQGSVAVTTTSGCSWSASSGAGWVTITSGSSGTGSGAVSYQVAANSATSTRTGTLTVAGQTVTVTQGGTSGGGGSYRYLVAGIAHASGAGGSAWRSNLAVTNRSGGTATVQMTYRFGASQEVRNLTLGHARIVEWIDVAVSLFGLGGNTSGAIEFVSDQPLLVTARTYNQSTLGTFGQFLPGVTEDEAVHVGELGILPQIKKLTAFRANIGFVDFGSATATVRTRLYSEQGLQLGDPVDSNVGPAQWKQENDIFARAGAGSASIAYATVEIISGSGPIWAYASVVDNDSGDPTTIPVYVE